MRFALIFAPYTHKLFAENLKIVDNKFGLFPPLHLLYAAAFLKRLGHETLFIDAHAEGITPEQCVARIREFGADMLAMNFTTYMFHDTLRWARRLKELTGLPLLAGGINLLIYPRECMSHPEIDYAVIGEAMPALGEFIEALQTGRGFESINGFAWRSGGEVFINPQVNYAVNFDNYPFPARELLDNSLYFEHISQRRNFTIALTATGCPYNCNFCAIPDKPCSQRSVESALAEAEECYSRFGIREIDYFDAVFTVNRRRTAAFCEGLIASGRDIMWACRARTDNIDRDLIALMARSGCSRIYFGIETPVEHILANIDKKIDMDDVVKVIGWCNEFKVRPLGFFMIGMPGDTRETVLRAINFSKKLNLDYAQFSRTIGKPRSLLNTQLIEATGSDYWSEFTTGSQPERRLPSPWTSLSEEEIERLTIRAYLSFYFRPRIILKALAKLRSGEELLRYIRVALMMLFHRKEEKRQAPGSGLQATGKDEVRIE